MKMSGGARLKFSIKPPLRRPIRDWPTLFVTPKRDHLNFDHMN